MPERESQTRSLHRRAWIAGVGGAVLAGCAAPPAPRPPRELVWPPPPEPARYRYEATLRNAASLGPPGSADAWQNLLGGGDLSRASFGKALGVAAHAGRVYVADTEGRRIFVFDLPRRRAFVFGIRREGELQKPAGVAVDGQGRVHVVDATARRVVVYDALGLYLREIRGEGWTRPTAVAVSADGARVVVVDTGGVASEQHRLHVHGADGRLLQRIGRRGAGPGEFNLPADAAFGPDGRLWVLDAGNFRVQAFDPEGRFLHAFGSLGNGLGQFARPRGLTVDDAGLVYVSDAAFCNVQVFRPDGALLLALGQRGEDDEPGRYLLPGKLAADEAGHLYVVDQYLHKIEVWQRLDAAEGLSAVKD